MRFAWDPQKAARNVRKHGVTFEEAATAFGDPLAFVVTDTLHSDRMLIVGETVTARLLVVVFVETSNEVVRIISARRATKHERRRYESGEES
jgi:uncharacterized DUF497 family protein